MPGCIVSPLPRLQIVEVPQVTVEVSMAVPVREGLKHVTQLPFQDADALSLFVGDFWCVGFLCRQPGNNQGISSGGNGMAIR